MDLEIIDTDELIPSDIRLNINKTISEAVSVIDTAYKFIEEFKYHFKFRFAHSALGDFLTNEERAQQLSFVTRYKYLPIFEEIELRENNGDYDIANLDYLRLLLNEYRTILFNKNDSIYYRKLHNFCYCNLSNKDSSKGLSIIVYDTNEHDRTGEYIKFLNENTKAIEYIISNCDLDYIYNGILQHSDSRHTNKYWDDFYSGKLNYIFLKNAILVSETKTFMDVYHKIMNCITFPILGHL